MIKCTIHSDINAATLDGTVNRCKQSLLKIQQDKMSGWLTLPQEYDQEEFQHIREATEQIRETSQFLVCVGIGGSYLGHRALIEALRGDGKVQVLYAGNSLSTSELQDVLGRLGDADFSVNVISKSGTTTEPAIAFRILRQKLIEKYGEAEAYRRIYATTDAKRGALHDEAVANDYTMFRVPDDIGGRYSVLTAVGLLPLAVAGVDIQELMNGAQMEMMSAGIGTDEEPSSKVGATDDVFRYAALRHILRDDEYDVEVLSTFEPRMMFFNEWWKQLFGESEGKEDQGIFPTSAIFTTDLHSLGQYLQQGRRDIFETMVTFEKNETSEPIIIPEASSDQDGLNYLAGKTLDFVNQQAQVATIAAHRQHIPVCELRLPDYSERSFGALIYFFELACALSATLQGVDPFNQPGVETYKQEMFRLLGKPNS